MPVPGREREQGSLKVAQVGGVRLVFDREAERRKRFLSVLLLEAPLRRVTRVEVFPGLAHGNPPGERGRKPLERRGPSVGGRTRRNPEGNHDQGVQEHGSGSTRAPGPRPPSRHEPKSPGNSVAASGHSRMEADPRSDRRASSRSSGAQSFAVDSRPREHVPYRSRSSLHDLTETSSKSVVTTRGPGGTRPQVVAPAAYGPGKILPDRRSVADPRPTIAGPDLVCPRQPERTVRRAFGQRLRPRGGCLRAASFSMSGRGRGILPTESSPGSVGGTLLDRHAFQEKETALGFTYISLTARALTAIMYTNIELTHFTIFHRLRSRAGDHSPEQAGAG